jgi:hypothetical protein
MAHAHQQRLNSAVAPSQHINRAGFEMIEESCLIIRHLLIGDRSRTVA